MLITLIFPSAMEAAGGDEPGKGPDIIPLPKMLELTGKRFVLWDLNKPKATIVLDKNDPKALLAAEEINDRIKIMGGRPLPTGAHASTSTAGNRIILGDPQTKELRGILNEQEIKDISSKGEQAYAIRFCKGEEGGEAVFLSGVGWQGLLHASSTFRLLIKREGAIIFAEEAQVTDWPDFKYRALPVWPLPASYDEFKKYVDWAFHYKFNRIYTYTTRRIVPDGFNLPTKEERHYLKRINNYARERGVIINYALNWAVGTVSSGENNTDYEGTVTFNNHYYTWSDDTLLKKRAAEIAQFAKETEAESLHFHCIDGYEEGWDERGKNDRARFGNDRALADANVINIFTREIRKINPGIELQFVVYPYHVNFDLNGNEKYKAWIKRLADLISKDVYLAVADLSSEQTESWVRIVEQPLVHCVNGNAFQWGRYFSTLPAFARTAYTAGRDRDIILNWEPIGYFSGEVMQLVAAEYAWNVDAPGSGYIKEDGTGKINVTGGDLHYRQETIGGKIIDDWGWYEATREPQETAGALLLKACRLEFGEAVAPYMADFFRNNPVGWRGASLYSQVLTNAMAGKELEASRDQLKKTETALLDLKKALTVVNTNSSTKEKLKGFLKNTYRQSLTITGTTAYHEGRQLLMKGLRAEASEEIRKGRQHLTEIRSEMARGGYWSDDSREWYEEGNGMLKTVEVGARRDASTNLVGNPGFEERSGSINDKKPAIPRWSTYGSLTLDKQAHSGNYAGELMLKPSEKFVLMEQAFKVRPECAGYVEFWLRKAGDFRVIPLFQYWDSSHSKKIEDLAISNFPSGSAVQNYSFYSGRHKFPPYVNEAVFKIYADWYGFSPTQEKTLSVDDVFVGCVSDD